MVFNTMYWNIKSRGAYPVVDPDIARRCFRRELFDAREVVSNCYDRIPEEISVRYYDGEHTERALCQDIKRYFGKCYQYDESLVSCYWDLCEKCLRDRIGEPGKLSYRINDCMPQILSFVSISDVQRALSEMQDLTENQQFFEIYRNRTLQAAKMRATIVRDMELVMRFVGQYGCENE